MSFSSTLRFDVFDLEIIFHGLLLAEWFPAFTFRVIPVGNKYMENAIRSVFVYKWLS